MELPTYLTKFGEGSSTSSLPLHAPQPRRRLLHLRRLLQSSGAALASPPAATSPAARLCWPSHPVVRSPSAPMRGCAFVGSPHAVAKIETEQMLITMVETELEKRKAEGKYPAHFRGQSHFFGYEGRCGLPTNFDSSYCYANGYGSGTLLQYGKTGLITSAPSSLVALEAMMRTKS